MKTAFTLLELIFVIVIVGILSGVAFYSFKPHYLRSDINFVLMKLEQTRYEAMGYDKSLPAADTNLSIGCITVADLSDTNNTKTNATPYKFHADFDASKSSISSSDTICFDTFGRVHTGIDANKATLSTLSSDDINLTYIYNGKEGNLSIDHLTGYIHISIQLSFLTPYPPKTHPALTVF